MDPAPHREPEGSERFLLLGGFLVMLAALIGIVLEDYEPVRLAPVFMLLAYFPLIAIHEAGHALMARAVGWEVEAMAIGFGTPVARFEAFGVPITVHVYPIAGWMRPSPTTLVGMRVKSALVYAAGPLAEVLVVATLTLVVGLDAMTTRTDDLFVIAAQAVALAALIDIVVNLIPRRVETESGVSVSDGLGVIASLLRPTESYARALLATHEARIEDAALLGELGRTIDACERAFTLLGDEPHLRTTMRAALDRLDEEHDVAGALRGRRLPPSLHSRFAESAKDPAARGR